MTYGFFLLPLNRIWCLNLEILNKTGTVLELRIGQQEQTTSCTRNYWNKELWDLDTDTVSMQFTFTSTRSPGYRVRLTWFV